jgi:hypothetical protein
MPSAPDGREYVKTLQFQDSTLATADRGPGYSPKDRPKAHDQDAPCILLAGESPELLDLRARILGAAGMLTSVSPPQQAITALAASFHDAVVICHSVSAVWARAIVDAAYERQRRTKTLLITRVPYTMPDELLDCHLDAVYCWHEGPAILLEKLRILLNLADHHA